jgi:putative ABC transport system permease protein
MTVLRRFVAGIRALLLRGRAEHELDEELRAYLDAAVERHMQAGLSREAATRAARIELGSVTAVKDHVRDAGWESLVDDLWQDTKYAVRTLRRSPGFTAVAVLTLALGIGANTAIFSIIDGMLIRPLGDEVGMRLVNVHYTLPPRPARAGSRDEVITPRMTPGLNAFAEWQRRNHVFDRMAIWRSQRLTLLDTSPVERVEAMEVTPQFFAQFDLVPALGRLLAESDVREPVALISYGAWQRRFGGDRAVVGRTVRTLEGARTIVGVLPAEFRFSPATDFWTPLQASAYMTTRPGWGGRSMARLRPGVSVEQAQRNMTEIASQLVLEGAMDRDAGVLVDSLHEWTVQRGRPMLLILMGAVGFVLLIACVNVAGLLVARGVGRNREMAVRSALGAGRSRLLRQLLAESVGLALAGGAAGALLASWTLDALVPLLPVNVPEEISPTVDVRMFIFTLLVSMVTGLLFGLLPALQMSKPRTTTELRQVTHATPPWAWKTSTSLIIVQTSLALVLLAGAALMIRSLQNVLAIDPGFEPEHVLVIEASPVMIGDGRPERSRAFYAGLVEHVKALPGVEAVAAIDTLPFWSYSLSAVEVDGARQTDLSNRRVLPGYFRAMGIPVKAGRDFDATDREGAPCTAVVNEMAVRQVWPDGGALGKRVRILRQVDWCEVVGVVGDVRHKSFEQDVFPELYFSALQKSGAGGGFEFALTVVARAQDPSALVSLARAQTENLTERALVEQVVPFERFVDRIVLERRNRAQALSVLGLLGVVLAGVGILGLTSYAVARKTHEIGIRIALGATGSRVLQTVIGGFVPAITGGVLLGLLGAWGLTRLLTRFLFGVTPTDPLTLGAVALLLTTVALLACYLPARRATTIDPMTALRCE